MKRIILFTLLTCCIFVFAACGSKKNEEILEVSGERFTYDIEEPQCYTVDKNGVLYNLRDEYILHEEGNYIIGKKLTIDLYNLEGELTEQHVLEAATSEIGSMDNLVRKVTVEEGILYILVEANGEFKLYSYNTETKEEKHLFVFEDFFKMDKLVAIGGRVYFTGQDVNAADKEYNGTDKAEDFEYEGMVFGYIDPATGAKEIVAVDFPIGISATPEDNIIVYAYDDTEGYYFAQYDTATGELGKAEYSDYGDGFSFVIIDEEKNFIYNRMGRGLFCAGPDKGIGEAMIETAITHSINKVFYMGGQLFYMDDERMLSRMSLEGNLKWNKPIKAIYSGYMVKEPFGCGYTVKTEKFESDEFALKVLAQDTDYDVCLLDSTKDVAANIKKNGIFYPLNEVEGVVEYIDACFPYIKDVALTKDGDVWMVPVYVEVPAIIYNKEIFREYNVTTDMVADMDGFTKVADKFAEETDFSMNLWYASLKMNAMDQYLSRYTSMDTQLFREFSGILFNRFNKKEAGYRDNTMFVNWQRGRLDRFLFIEVEVPSTKIDLFAETTEYGVIPFPVIEEEIKNQASCILMSVNPESDNLESVLDYISEYSKYMLEQKNSFILADISTYDDTVFCRELYDCYAKAEITFRIDSDIFFDNYDAYLNEKITLEECITESERKLKMYLDE